MNIIKLTFSSLVVSVFSLLLAPAAAAQAARTFVSAQGNDGFTCDTPSKPCRNIQAGITKVQAGGEVVVITSGSYLPFTVNKAVTVAAARGEHVGISFPSGAGVLISAGSADVVVLRGLTFNGPGVSLPVGVQFFSGGALYVEGCVINGFTDGGGMGAATGKLYVRDTVISNNGGGLSILGPVTASLERVRVVNNFTGIGMQNGARVAIRDSVIAGQVALGIVGGPTPAGTAVEVSIENCQITGNGSGPVAGGGDGATVMSVSNSVITNNGTGINSLPNGIIRVSNTTVVHNMTGLLITGGSILSRGNNTVEGNATDGSFSGAFTAK